MELLNKAIMAVISVFNSLSIRIPVTVKRRETGRLKTASFGPVMHKMGQGVGFLLALLVCLVVLFLIFHRPVTELVTDSEPYDLRLPTTVPTATQSPEPTPYPKIATGVTNTPEANPTPVTIAATATGQRLPRNFSFDPPLSSNVVGKGLSHMEGMGVIFSVTDIQLSDDVITINVQLSRTVQGSLRYDSDKPNMDQIYLDSNQIHYKLLDLDGIFRTGGFIRSSTVSSGSLVFMRPSVPQFTIVYLGERQMFVDLEKYSQ